MRDKTGIHTVLVMMLSLGCVGLTLVSISQHWEYWVPPILLVWMVALWVLHLKQSMSVYRRETVYFLFGAVLTLFHGVHETSYFDVAIAFSLVMMAFLVLERKGIERLFYMEYMLVTLAQVILALRHKSQVFDSLGIARILLHMSAVTCIYYVCCKVIGEFETVRADLEEKTKEKEEASVEMEDFLVNISHELRTPVNVVNGMSSIVLKNGMQPEVFAIREAGLRLSRQIEDIQDYTEINQNKVMVENEKYMITSLINDVLTGFRVQEGKKNLEMVVDLDPQVPSVMRGDIKKLQKILRHLIDNAMKFTRRGGIYIRINAVPRDYGVNLGIEVRDTGIGMSRNAISNASKGFYQANKKRNRSSGGIGLGLNVVYGFVHKMDGFVTIESSKGKGTRVFISVPQEVLDASPCLSLRENAAKDILFHVAPEKYTSSVVRDYYRALAVHLATGLNVNLYNTVNENDIRKMLNTVDVSHIFMGAEEYEKSPVFFDELAASGLTVAVAAHDGFTLSKGSTVNVIPKPLYGYPVTKIINGDAAGTDPLEDERINKPIFDGITALVVDDEPMNLVVAMGMFKDYGLITETADSGREAVEKCRKKHYDVVFMDHMMPEMDGVEAMKLIKQDAVGKKDMIVVALTANAVSGAREMFLREGFDGFIAKPIDIMEFERTMKKLFATDRISYVGRDNA